MFSEYFFKSKSLFYSLLVTLPLFIIYEIGIFFLFQADIVFSKNGADVLIEEHVEKVRLKIEKDVAKGIKRFGDDFDEEQFRATNPNVLRNQSKIDDINDRFKTAMDNDDLVSVLDSNTPFTSQDITSLILSPNKMRLYAISSDKMIRCVYSSNGNIIWDAPVDESSFSSSTSSTESSSSSLVFNNVLIVF